MLRVTVSKINIYPKYIKKYMLKNKNINKI